MQKRIVVLALVALVAAFGLAAQTAPATTAGMTDSRAIALEAGLAIGYNINSSALTAGNNFGLMITVSDNLAVGFAATRVATTYNMFKLAYFVSPALGFNLQVGTGGGTAAGAGVFYNAFKSRSETGISTALKLKLEYLFTTASVTTGDLVLSVGSTFGL